MLRGVCGEFCVIESQSKPIKGEKGKVARLIHKAALITISFVDKPGFPESVIDTWKAYSKMRTKYPAYHDRMFYLDLGRAMYPKGQIDQDKLSGVAHA